MTPMIPAEEPSHMTHNIFQAQSQPCFCKSKGGVASLGMAPKASKMMRAKKGEGMDGGDLAKMLGMLKYQSKNGQGQRQEESVAALDTYKALSDPCDRVRFLKEFEAHGNGKTPGSLKWTVTFKKTLSNIKETEISAVENWLTRLVYPVVLVCVPMCIWLILFLCSSCQAQGADAQWPVTRGFQNTHRGPEVC